MYPSEDGHCDPTGSHAHAHTGGGVEEVLRGEGVDEITILLSVAMKFFVVVESCPAERQLRCERCTVVIVP